MSLSRSSRRFVSTVLSAALFPILAAGAVVNQPPSAPLVTEPDADGLTLNPADVHMETAPFSDPDGADQHLCTDWEIWTVTPLERVWAEACATGLDRVHTHLGNGAFENSHAGQSELAANTDFVLRVRHRDDSGDPVTEWSAWSQRTFHTGNATQVFPLELEDVASAPVPRWVVTHDGSAVILPLQTRTPKLLLESAAGELLLAIRPSDGASNEIRNPPALSGHVSLRIRIEGGSVPIMLPETDLLIVDDHCETHRILLPEISFSPLSTQILWVTPAGTTYDGTTSQTSPDFSTLARGLSPPWFPRQKGFRVEVFAGGLQLPVNIAFVPNPGTNPGDPFLYVTELHRDIKVVTRDRTVSTYASGLLDYVPPDHFPGDGEQGLAGIAVDPATGDVFASMLYASAANPGLHFPKVVRLTSADGGRTAASRTTILDMVNENSGASHQVSNLTIAPDGKLVCHMGDGFDGLTAQDLDSFRGKILRLNLDGSPATDNPFYDAGDGISARDYVFAYGLRNPFGGDWRAADGMHYEVENGPNVDRFAKILPGRNFGWDGSNASMSNFAIYNWSPAHAPVNLVFVQPETFAGSGFPASTMGHAFVAEAGPTHGGGPQLHGKRVSEFILDAGGSLVAGPIPFLDYASNGRATACGLEAGPDGLYMTELYPDLYPDHSDATLPRARILRVYFDPGADCNGNGIDDVCDVAGGTSTDTDGNWIPDECESSGTPFCFGDGSSGPCPCGNPGAAGRGCENSFATGGALLTTTGSANLFADTLVLTSSGERTTSLTIFLQGAVQVAPLDFGDGLRCVDGALERLYTKSAGGGIATAPTDGEPTVSARSAAVGDPISAGEIRYYMTFYRDPSATFCPRPSGGSFNASNARRIDWQ